MIRLRNRGRRTLSAYQIGIFLTLILVVSFSRSKSSVYKPQSASIGRQSVTQNRIDGIDFLYQLPSESPLEGILFVAHGCSHSMTDWFRDCNGCIGLAEEVAIVDMATKEFGFLVVAVSSVDRQSKCWSYQDQDRIKRVLQHLYEKFDKPRHVIAFGASSGGAFVGSHLLDLTIPFDGFISQVMTRGDQDDNPYKGVYITMEKDPHTRAQAESLVDKRKAATLHIQLHALPITKGFFKDRIDIINGSTSRVMYEALRGNGYLDERGYISQNPRKSDWRTIIAPLVKDLGDALVADRSSISEVMNVAYNQHELARDGVREALTFLLKN